MLFNDNIRVLHEVISILAKEPFITNLAVMYMASTFLGLIGATTIIISSIVKENKTTMRNFININIRNWMINKTTTIINRTFDSIDNIWGWTQDKKDAAVEGVKNAIMATVLAAVVMTILTIQLAEEIRDFVVGKTIEAKSFIVGKKDQFANFCSEKKQQMIDFVTSKKDQVINYIQAKKQERADRIAAAAAAVEKARLEQLNKDIVAAGGVTIEQARVMMEEVEELKAKVAKIEASAPAPVLEVVDLRARYSAKANTNHAVKVVRKAINDMSIDEMRAELNCGKWGNTQQLRSRLRKQRANN